MRKTIVLFLFFINKNCFEALVFNILILKRNLIFGSIHGHVLFYGIFSYCLCRLTAFMRISPQQQQAFKRLKSVTVLLIQLFNLWELNSASKFASVKALKKCLQKSAWVKNVTSSILDVQCCDQNINKDRLPVKADRTWLVVSLWSLIPISSF